MALLVSATGQSPGGNYSVTNPIDTTGALALVVAISVRWSDVNITDSYNNTWVRIPNNGSLIEGERRFYLCSHPIVGPGHTVQSDDIRINAFPSLLLTAWDHPIPTWNVESAHRTDIFQTQVQPGSVTPGQPNELVMTACYVNPDGSAKPTAVNEDFDIICNLANIGFVAIPLAVAYKYQPTTDPLDPTWIYPSPTNSDAIIAAYSSFEPPPTPPIRTYSVVETNIRRVRRSPHLSNEQKRIFYPGLEIDLQRGIGNVAAPGVNPQVMLRISRDGGETWGPETWMSAGRLGEYTKRVLARNLGYGRDVVFEVIVSDPNNWNLIAAIFDPPPIVGRF